MPPTVKSGVESIYCDGSRAPFDHLELPAAELGTDAVPLTPFGARCLLSSACPDSCRYTRVSQWAKRHDKSGNVNYVAPEVSTLEEELSLIDRWFKRVKGYKK